MNALLARLTMPLRKPTRTVELACFLHHALLITNDTILSLCDMCTTDLRRQAQELANKTVRIELQEIRSLLSRTRQCAEDADQSDAQVRQIDLDTLPSAHGAPVSRAHRYRDALAADRYPDVLLCLGQFITTHTHLKPYPHNTPPSL